MGYREIRYSRAAGTYHQASGVQKEMASELAALLPRGIKPHSILELGCGTGHLSRVLLTKFPGADFILTDISPEMLDQCQALLQIGGFTGTMAWDHLDANNPISYQENRLVCSNALIQWMPDPLPHFQHVYNSLAKGGCYLFSSFRDDNFPELQRLLRVDPFNLTQFPGHKRETIIHALGRAGFSTTCFRQAEKSKYYPSFEHFLKVLKRTGAGGRPDLVMTRSKLRFLSEKFTRFNKFGSGILTTWKPCYVLAEKLP